MDSAVLDELWTEAGIYASNTTQTYYRTVRGHQLTYEAPRYPKWPMLKSWLDKYDYKYNAVVEEFAQGVGENHNNADNRAKLGTEIDHLAVRYASPYWLGNWMGQQDMQNA